jgi:hypothetical protein
VKTTEYAEGAKNRNRFRVFSVFRGLIVPAELWFVPVLTLQPPGIKLRSIQGSQPAAGILRHEG